MGSVALSCVSSPSGPACTSSAASVTVNGSPTNFTVTFVAPAEALSKDPVFPADLHARYLAVAAIPLGVFALCLRRRKNCWRSFYNITVAVLVLSGAVLFLASCGGSPPSPPNPPSQSYTLTVSGASAGQTRTVQLSITVQ
jgi:hypothetical protein